MALNSLLIIPAANITKGLLLGKSIQYLPDDWQDINLIKIKMF